MEEEGSTRIEIFDNIGVCWFFFFYFLFSFKEWRKSRGGIGEEREISRRGLSVGVVRGGFNRARSLKGSLNECTYPRAMLLHRGQVRTKIVPKW